MMIQRNGEGMSERKRALKYPLHQTTIMLAALTFCITSARVAASQSPTMMPSSASSDTYSEFPSAAEHIESNVPSLGDTSIPTQSTSLTGAPSIMQSMDSTISVDSGMPSIVNSEVPSSEPYLLSSEQPTMDFSQLPTQVSSPDSNFPTIVQSSLASGEPSVGLSSLDSEVPTLTASIDSSNFPTQTLSNEPSIQLSMTEEPSNARSEIPSTASSLGSSAAPTQVQSVDSSETPTMASSIDVIDSSEVPTVVATGEWSASPSQELTVESSTPFSHEPTMVPTIVSSSEASLSLSIGSSMPTQAASVGSSQIPSLVSSVDPTFESSIQQSQVPTLGSSEVSTGISTSEEPSTTVPSSSQTPTTVASSLPSNEPSLEQSMEFSPVPTGGLSSEPQSVGTEESSFPRPKDILDRNRPSLSSAPSQTPSFMSSGASSNNIASSEPTLVDSEFLFSQTPSELTSEIPTEAPSLQPSEFASGAPSESDSAVLSAVFSSSPSVTESEMPSNQQTLAPSIAESSTPSDEPSLLPTTTISASPSTDLSKAISISTDPAFTPIHINAGGNAFTDSNNISWDADNFFNTGNEYTAKTGSVTGTVDDEMYLSERWDPPSGDELVYGIPVPSGDYDVTLYFSENYVDSVGARVFNISMEGDVVFPNFDIFAEANGEFKATSLTETVSVIDGTLDIEFARITENPKLSGIRVAAAAGASSKGGSASPSMGPSESTHPSVEPSNGPTRTGTEAPSASQSPSWLPSAPPSSAPSLGPSVGPSWIDMDENENYTARHECSFVQAGTKFYMFGGRESPRKMDTYDYTSDSWSEGASPPLEFNHFQAVEFEGLIWVIGSYRTNDFPDEVVTEHVYVYDPANDEWMQGPPIPENRRRGGGGLQVYNGTFYLVGGNISGHNSGFVPWMDSFDPSTGQWTQLADAPHARDHFHAVVLGNKLFAAGGRRTAKDVSNNIFGDTVAEVDVYDFMTETWIDSNLPDDLESPRAGAATVAFDGKILLAGGESLSSTQAHDDVDALDPVTGQWERLASLNHARHGTQAIVSGNGVYIAGGSPIRGGGRQKNMEVYSADDPVGEENTAGVLGAPSIVYIAYNAPATQITLAHVGGNQGVFVQSVSISGPSAIDFALADGEFTPVLIGKDSSLDLGVKYNALVDGAIAQLNVTFSGDKYISVTLIGSADPTDSHAPSSQPSLAPSSQSLLTTSTSQPLFDPIYINAGGGAFTDDNDITWLADSYFNTGRKSVATGAVTGKLIDDMYLSERWDASSGDELVYNISVPNGDYEVVLHFSETYVNSANARVFNVLMEGNVVFPNVDIFAESGGGFQVLTRNTIVSVTDGALTIEFTRVTQNPCVSGIEIHAMSLESEESSSSLSMSPSSLPSSEPSNIPTLSVFPSFVPSSGPSETASQEPSGSNAPSTLKSQSAFPTNEPLSFDTVRINCGGNPFTDSNGNLWDEDAFFNTGIKYTARDVTISGTAEQSLYLSERYDTATGSDLEYSIPVPAGEYQVTLYFSENYSGAQKVNGRVFNVLMEGEVVFPMLDIFVESGGAFQAMNRTATVSVLDGTLNIDFARIKQNPKVSGIEVRAVTVAGASPSQSSEPSSVPSTSLFPSTQPSMTPSSADSVAPSISQKPTMLSSGEPSVSASEMPSLSGQPSSTPSAIQTASASIPIMDPIRINAGGGNYIDSNGLLWDADNYYNVGRKYTARGVAIAGTIDDSIFQSERYHTGSTALVYDIPVPNGDYKVTCFWAENYATSAGVRVFTVSMENVITFPNVDIFSESGGANQAMNKTATVSVSDGSLTISFSKNLQNPKISAIEITSLTMIGSESPSVSAVPSSPPSTSATAISSQESSKPSSFPSTSLLPSLEPSSKPTIEGTSSPSISQMPSYSASGSPSAAGSETPSLSLQPTLRPSFMPSTIQTVSAGTPPMDPIRINAGGDDYTDSNGLTWDADTYFNTGKKYTARGISIAGTDDGTIFKSERYHTGSSTLVYDIPVPNGEYEATLYWAENYATAAGVRVFNVAMEGDIVFPDVDIFAESGGANQAMNKTEIVSVSDGFLTIEFSRVLQNPKISALEITALSMVDSDASTISAAPSSPQPASMQPSFEPSNNPSLAYSEMPSNADSQEPSLAQSISAEPSMEPTGVSTLVPTVLASGPSFDLFINCGGPEYVDSNNNTWIADKYFNTGNSYPVTYPIAGTDDEAIYQSERWDPPSGAALRYEIPNVPNGNYGIIFYFAEVYAKSSGKRMFGVAVEDVLVIEDLDIFAVVGGNTSLAVPVPVTIEDNTITIDFVRGLENPKVNAIEIHSTSLVAPTPLASEMPSTVPSSAPSARPSASMAPTMSSAPSMVPSISTEPSAQPSNRPSAPPVPFEPIYINAGADSPVVDSATGNTWQADNFYNTGSISTSTKIIAGTSFEELYQSERYDKHDFPNLQYSIPLPDGRFQVLLHFSETWKGAYSVGARKFNVYIEDALELEELDIFATVGKDAALVEDFFLDISDGFLDIQFEHVVENPKLNGIEVHPVGAVKPHYAHAVPGGAYSAVDIDNTGNATVAVNGFFSHTHAPGAQLISWDWKVNGTVVATGEQALIDFDVGDHILVLRVEDNVGDYSEDFTTVTVRPYGYPFIASLSPAAGEMIGGDKIVITGSGFNISASQTVVNFGSVVLTGPSEIKIVDDSTIEVLSNPQSSWGKVDVTVTTPLDTSNAVQYEYLPEIPLTFLSGDVETGGLFGPTCAAFGPDGNLYVTTQGGDLIKYVLDEGHNVNGNETIWANVTLSTEYSSRAILGITFDPMDTCPPEIGCTVYIAHSTLYHNQLVSYNGVVSKVSGPYLETIEHVVTGLPISDHDHGVNGLEFDDNGNLYIQVGGNTNAGVPGALSTSQLQEEDLFSAATLIARNVNSPSFDGFITYDANGDQLSGFGVSVFAPGMRNPYGITYHSNGRLYGTDNGPNFNFGKKSISCTEGDDGPDPYEKDKLNLIEEGNYYGHANRKRGETDPRQCSWRNGFVPSDNYTMPIKQLVSSTNGIVEFQSNHFDGVLRGELIVSRYKGALYHIKLTNDGTKTAGALTDKPPTLLSQGGVDVTQGPDGTLFSVSNFLGKVRFHAPDEDEAELMTVKSIFPRRGPEAGNTTLTIYGQKMFDATQDPTVTVGGIDCPVTDTKIYTDITLHEMQWVKCTLPVGVGTADVVVSFNAEVYTFSSYRYISGQPPQSAIESDMPSEAPSSSSMPSTAPSLQLVDASSSDMPSGVPTRSPSASPSTSAPATSLFFDTGALGEDISMVTGTTGRYEKTVTIGSTLTPEYFQSHRYGSSFAYTIDGLTPGGTYTVSLGFAEIWEPNCDIGQRIMAVSLNGNVVNPELDVFKEVGCETAHLESYSVQATSVGKIEIGLSAFVENAMLSLIEVLN